MTGVRVPLSALAHGRSGDKGNHANVAVIAYTDAGYAWLRAHLTADRVAAYFAPLGLTGVDRYEAANVRGLNFVLRDALAGGASTSLRTDTQGKTFALALLRLEVDVPPELATGLTNTRLTSPVCSLLLFVATPAEEDALREQAAAFGLPFRKDAALTKHLRAAGLGDDAWSVGTVGGETAVAVGCSRFKGRAVMGPHGRLGSAAKGVRYLAATGAQGIMQVGMAFGIARGRQQLGDVLVSTSLLPYDQRDVTPSEFPPGYVNDYSAVKVEPARPALVELCRREMRRTTFGFAVHAGAILSGAARVHGAAFRDELYNNVPHGNDPIIGGEMEGVGLLAPAAKADDPVWCVVKGVSDFADERRREDIETGKVVAPRNAARFLFSALVNDARGLAGREDV